MTFWRKRLDHAGADKINAGLDIITLEKEEGEKGLMIWVTRPGFCSWQENAAMQALRDISLNIFKQTGKIKCKIIQKN